MYVFSIFCEIVFQFEARGLFEEELSALRSVVFGFIEIPREKRSLMKPKAEGTTVVWVREDRADAVARFKLHSFEMPKPVVSFDFAIQARHCSYKGRPWG